MSRTGESARRIGVRWLKFSLVGAVGIAVQLAILALLTRWHMHYLLASLLAVEAAVLHNFACHERYTWCDRGHSSRCRALLTRMARFHAANGLISIAGNVLLMRLLVGQLGIAVLPANVASIASCSLANFLVSDRWVFLARAPSTSRLGGAIGHQQ